MRFELKEENGFIPDFECETPGRELSCFIPDGYLWEQINYGQGEGQVVINNCEWGFYYSDDNAISIVLHTGTITVEEGLQFVSAVKEKIFGENCNSVKTLIVAG